MKTNEQLINKQIQALKQTNKLLNDYERQANILNNYILKLINNEIDLNQLQQAYNKIRNIIVNAPDKESEAIQLKEIQNTINNNELFCFVMFLIERNTEQEINETLYFLLEKI